MKRGGTLARKTPLRARATPMRKTPMRKGRRKTTPARQSARGQECLLNFPGCTYDTTKVVLCHVRQFGGGGERLKPPDNEAVYGCDHCHDLLDNRIPWILEPPPGFDFWKAVAFALVKTQRVMRELGVLIMKGEAA